MSFAAAGLKSVVREKPLFMREKGNAQRVSDAAGPGQDIPPCVWVTSQR